MAFLSFVKSNNDIYVYLKEYKKQDLYSSTSYNYVYSFGRIDKAQQQIHAMLYAYDLLFPDYLKNKGFNKNDLKKWINRIENKRKEEDIKRAII